MTCIQHENPVTLSGSSLFLTISLFLHLFPLLVPLLKVSFHVLFFLGAGTEPSLSGVTEGGMVLMQEREECICGTLGWDGGRVCLGLGIVLGRGGIGRFGWTMKRSRVSMDDEREEGREV